MFAAIATAFYQPRADKHFEKGTQPDPVHDIRKTASQKSWDFTIWRFEARGERARASVYRFAATVFIVESVLAALVAAVPWLWWLGVCIGFSAIAAAISVSGKLQIINTRVGLGEYVIDFSKYSTSNDIILPQQAVAYVEIVFTTPSSELSALQQNLEAARQTLSAGQRAYLIERGFLSKDP